MKAKTSNTLFLGALAMSAAALGLLAAPASADAVADAPVPTCVDGICYRLPASDVDAPLRLEPVDDVPISADTRIESVPFQPARPTLGFDLGNAGDMDAFIGSVDRRTDSGAPDLLGDDARIPTNFEIEPVRSVAGLGLRSTF